MKEKMVSIDFEKVATTFRMFVREKAIKAGSTIVYKKNAQIIEEDPKTSKKIVLQNFETRTVSL